MQRRHKLAWFGSAVQTVLIMKALHGIGQERITGYGRAVTIKKTVCGTPVRRQDGFIVFELLPFTGTKDFQVAITLSVIIGAGFLILGHGLWAEHMPAIATWDFSFRPCNTDLRI
ncbi:MAG: hypothetical protein HHJ09_10575 [Glaciimonas sp.]|nr:hypothetical protein [Glaciimonas sp.]